MTPLIDLKGLTICTPERALVEDVEMVVYPGRVTALVGPSGAGKSLTARCSMGVIDVAPGLTAGTLRYPAVDPDKDWYEGDTSPSRELLHVLASGCELRAQSRSDHWSAARDCHRTSEDSAFGHGARHRRDPGRCRARRRGRRDASWRSIRWNGSARGTRHRSGSTAGPGRGR